MNKLYICVVDIILDHTIARLFVLFPLAIYN